MADVSARWATQSITGAAYAFVVEREPLARLAGGLLWGTDTRLIFDQVAAIGEVTGAAVLDVPCGGGLAFRALRNDQHLRYVAADISPNMLARARQVAASRGLEGIEFTEAGIEALPFADGEFDLGVTFNGLHCMPDPALAVAELARCLTPGGRLIGSCALRGAGWRYDMTIRALRRFGMFGPGGTEAELRSWLTGAGLAIDHLRVSGAIATFTATR